MEGAAHFGKLTDLSTSYVLIIKCNLRCEGCNPKRPRGSPDPGSCSQTFGVVKMSLSLTMLTTITPILRNGSRYSAEGVQNARIVRELLSGHFF